MTKFRFDIACLVMIFALPVLPGTTRAQESPTPGTAAERPDGQRQVVIYRCTDAAGRVTIQNDVACPKGTKQQRQAIDVPPPVPAYVPREKRMPALVAAERADEAAAIAAEAKAPASASVDADDAEAADVAATDSEEAADAESAATEAEDAEADSQPQPEASASAPATTASAIEPGAAPALPGAPPALYACRTWDERDFLTEDATPAERCAPLQVVAADGSTREDAAACEKVKDQCEAVPAESLCTAWQRRVDEAEFRWKFAGARQDDERRHEYELLKARLAQSDCAGNQNP